MPKYDDLPYRPCAGLCVINRKGLVFIGRRTDGPEHVEKTHAWQMPQGGMTRAKSPTRRRCASSTRRPASSRSRSSAKSGLAHLRHPEKDRHQGVEGQVPRPEAEMVRAALHRQGQRDDVEEPGGGHDPEFVEWRWEPMENLPDLVVPFKRDTYARVAKASPSSRSDLALVSAQASRLSCRACPGHPRLTLCPDVTPGIRPGMT